MNQPDHDELGTQLTSTLTEHADVMAGSTFGLAEVQGRARSIRRRRTATAVAGVAAAVAVIVPTVTLASHTGGTSEPGPSVTQTPSPTITATEDTGHQPAPGVLDVSDLPTGEAPSMDFLENGVLHQADGGAVPVGTRYPAGEFVVLSDGSRVWHTFDNGHPYVEVQGADGTFRDPVRSQAGLAVNAKHTIAAWMTPSGQVMVWSEGATEPAALGDPITVGSELRLAAVSGDDCPQACSVYVNVSTNQGWQPWEASLNGTVQHFDGGYLMIADISQAGLSIGYRKITDFGTCSTLLGGGEFEGFTTCNHTLASFSPDGRLILADPAYHDGIGNGVIAMYDLDGHRLFERQSTQKSQSFYPEAQWEDGTHVLAPVFQDGRWSIVRFASDGSIEYAVAPVRGNDMDNPFVLPTGGMPQS